VITLSAKKTKVDALLSGLSRRGGWELSYVAQAGAQLVLWVIAFAAGGCRLIQFRRCIGLFAVA